jgi:hypothetical protein
VAGLFKSGDALVDRADALIGAILVADELVELHQPQFTGEGGDLTG